MRSDAARRGSGFALALGIEVLIILLLLSLGLGRDDEREFVTISSFDVSQPATPAEAETAEPETSPSQAQPEASTERLPDAPAPVTRPPLAVVPSPYRLPPPPEAAPQATPTSRPSSSIGAVVRSDRTYGPANTGNPRGEDTERVGTAPDGSPLYAARWYREPAPDQLSGYLSAASGPGWGLIACRTAPNWRVEDCEVISESPQNSGIARAVQAAAWQFQVRPPRIGGEYQVGTWVRIRIDYTNAQRRAF